MQLAIVEQQNVVTTFVSLLAKEETPQAGNEKKTEIGKDDIVLTGTQCK